MQPAKSKFLEGNFAPVTDERDDDGLEVIGEVPRELDGWFVRNGPNPQFHPLQTYHWFAGDGMLHAVELREGRARYRNRYVRTEGWQREHDAGRALWAGDLGMPDFENPNGPTRGNTANTALVHHHGKLLALWEAGPPHEVSPSTLETVGLETFGGKLDFPCTAHPRVDPSTGELCFFGYNMIAPPYLTYGEVSPSGAMTLAREVPLQCGSMIHDFVITKNFAVIPVFPFLFEVERAMAGADPFVFREDLPTRFAVIPRGDATAPVRWFEAPSCYVFHYANAYELDGTIVIVGCRMPKASIDFEDGTVQANSARLHRWVIELSSGVVRESPIDDVSSDFPRIHEGVAGREARYAYTARVKDASPLGDADQFSDGWIKYDLLAGRSIVHEHGSDVFGGEGVFVSRRGATSEDDGWIVGFAHNRRENRSELRIVDARSMDANPVARVLLKRRVPYGFHGAWVQR
jgi:carotenoid cleavage dioxygenase-like enzyme